MTSQIADQNTHQTNLQQAGQPIGPSIDQPISQTVSGNDIPFCERGKSASGDAIFLVGQAGLARTGLLALEAMGPDARTRYPEACAAHLRPRPRISEGRILARCPDISLMDLSDGIARDLPRLLGETLLPPLGADILLTTEHIPAEVHHYALANNLDPLDMVMLGGEDYALLGTCPQEAVSSLQTQIPDLHRIGTVTEGGGITLNGQPWQACGFDHFS